MLIKLQSIPAHFRKFLEENREIMYPKKKAGALLHNFLSSSDRRIFIYLKVGQTWNGKQEVPGTLL